MHLHLTGNERRLPAGEGRLGGKGGDEAAGLKWGRGRERAVGMGQTGEAGVRVQRACPRGSECAPVGLRAALGL